MSELRAAHGTSRNIERLDFVAEPSHLKKYSVEAHVSDSKRILEYDPIRLRLGKHAQSFRPEPAVIFLASLVPGAACGLAWWSPSEKSNSPIFGGIEFADVWLAWDTPSGFKEGSASFVIFTEGNGSESAGASGHRKATDARKEVEVCESVL